MSSAAAQVSVLVTGVGDTVGQALLKAARSSSVPCHLTGTDRVRPNVGLAWADAGYILPHCSREHEYLTELLAACREEGVQLILPGSEKELEVLARHSGLILSEVGAVVVASPPDVLQIAMDKWETCRFLERASLGHPGYARLDVAGEVEDLVATVGFPLVAKPRRGTGSRGLHQVDSWDDIAFVRQREVPMVVQERLEPDDQEYSVAAFTTQRGRSVGAISYRREQLVAGDTYRAHVGRHTVVEAEAMRVVNALRPVGPCNVQLRLTERGPVTFEINPRFSGGVSMRAHYGYNEVEMAIRDYVLREPILEPRITTGTALRFWEEMYVEDQGQGVPSSG